jgi:hypothetical protein
MDEDASGTAYDKKQADALPDEAQPVCLLQLQSPATLQLLQPELPMLRALLGEGPCT